MFDRNLKRIALTAFSLLCLAAAYQLGAAHASASDFVSNWTGVTVVGTQLHAINADGQVWKFGSGEYILMADFGTIGPVPVDPQSWGQTKAAHR